MTPRRRPFERVAAQIVLDDDLVFPDKALYQVRADETRPTGDENPIGHALPSVAYDAAASASDRDSERNGANAVQHAGVTMRCPVQRGDGATERLRA